MVINVGVVYKIIYKLALFSILLSNVRFIHTMILDCLTALQVINDNQQVVLF